MVPGPGSPHYPLPYTREGTMVESEVYLNGPQPTGDVIVSVASSDPSEATVSTSTLTFTNSTDASGSQFGIRGEATRFAVQKQLSP